MSKRKTKHVRYYATEMIKECPSCKGRVDVVRQENVRILICQSCGRNFGEVPPARGAYGIERKR